MRLLTVREQWRGPEADSELMSRVIRFYERAPRANSHRRTAGPSVGAVLVEVLKLILLVATGTALVALALMF